MAMVDQASGCKVGWKTFDTLDEALACAGEESARAWDMKRRGYDFGYLCPGDFTHVPDHPDHGECWVVTTT